MSTTTETKPLDVSQLNAARWYVADAMEEIGTLSMHLREAIECAEAGRVEFATDSLEDALEAADNAIREITKIRDRAGRWAVWAEGITKQTKP
jgi:hypothetical protein